MPFDRAFRLSSILLAATSFMGLLLAHSVPMWLGSITGIILVVALVQAGGFPVDRWVRRQAAPATSSDLGNIFVIGAFLLFVLDLVVLSRDLLPAGIHFLVMLLAIKLVSLTHRRDFRHLYAISLMAILASAALTTDLWYVPIFALYLLTAVWTLLLYHLTHESNPPVGGPHSYHRQESSDAPIGISGRFFWLTNGMAVVTFALTLTIFFLLPRIGAGMLQKTQGAGLKTTGFSERVDLGMIGSVKQDPQVVMRVELPDLPVGRTDRLYLRGMAYDRYNGRSWSTSQRHRRHLTTFGDGTFVVRADGRRTPDRISAPIQQDILLEALDASVLFAVPFAEYLSGDLSGVQSDSMTGLYLSSPPSSRIRYSVISRQREMIPYERTAAVIDYPPSILERYLQLPELSEQVGGLSRHITRHAATPYDRMTAIHEYLLRDYHYSLDVETTTSLHPLEDFLFTSKTGYCEHYATAMVIMLRAAGIPARLVTGFLATEWNEFGEYFTVRQRDAHAWVEVYFPQSGWITFDPTPATGTVPTRSSWDPFYRISESLRLYWDRLVIRYSARDQLAVIYGIREGSDTIRDHISGRIAIVRRLASQTVSTLGQFLRSASADTAHVWWGLAALGFFAIALLARRPTWLKPSSQRLAQRRQSRIIGLYRAMLQTAAGKGFLKSPTATPTEFARIISREWTAAGAIVTGVTSLYCRGRFSGISLSAEELSEAEHHIRSLQQLARSTR